MRVGSAAHSVFHGSGSSALVQAVGLETLKRNKLFQFILFGSSETAGVLRSLVANPTEIRIPFNDGAR